MLFDLLVQGGDSLLRTPYRQRRDRLFEAVHATDHVQLPHADHGDVGRQLGRLGARRAAGAAGEREQTRRSHGDGPGPETHGHRPVSPSSSVVWGASRCPSAARNAASAVSPYGTNSTSSTVPPTSSAIAWQVSTAIRAASSMGQP